MENKTLFQNYWFMGVFAVLLSIALNKVIMLLLELLHIKKTIPLGDIITPFILGYVYAKKFNDVIPKKGRAYISLIYVVILAIIASSYGGFGEMVLTQFLIYLTLASLIVFIYFYWALGFSGRIVCKTTHPTHIRVVKEKHTLKKSKPPTKTSKKQHPKHKKKRK
ncbi:hypothetical protein ACFL0W_05275 [Nanoarchaeota archaeon]